MKQIKAGLEAFAGDVPHSPAKASSPAMNYAGLEASAGSVPQSPAKASSPAMNYAGLEASAHHEKEWIGGQINTRPPYLA